MRTASTTLAVCGAGLIAGKTALVVIGVCALMALIVGACWEE